MKNVIFALCSILFFFATACSKENEDNNQNNTNSSTGSVTISGISFKKVDLSGANALALAAPGAVAKSSVRTKAGDGDAAYLLYKVDENGTLVEVEYTIEVGGLEGSEGGEGQQESGEQAAVQEITANLKLAMEYIYTIGDKWLWLYNCRYYCENLEQINNESLKAAVTKLINDFGSGHSFLVRRSDGALFLWSM